MSARAAARARRARVRRVQLVQGWGAVGGRGKPGGAPDRPAPRPLVCLSGVWLQSAGEGGRAARATPGALRIQPERQWRAGCLRAHSAVRVRMAAGAGRPRWVHVHRDSAWAVYARVQQLGLLHVRVPGSRLPCGQARSSAAIERMGSRSRP